MELQQLVNADYLDIIYNNRNKNYGGYELRKHYSRRMLKAVLLLLLTLTSLALLSFLKRPAAKPDERKPVELVINMTHVEPPIFEKPKLEMSRQAATNVKTEKFTVPKIVVDPKPDDKTLAKVDDLKNAVVGAETKTGNPADGSSTISGPVGPATVIADVTPPKPATPLIVSQVMPAFDGDLHAYLATHLRYPEAARENDIEGQVIIRFVVNEDGSVSEATVARGIGGGCDEEALRIVRSMPRWKPGKNNGLPVKVFFALPIKFQLQ